MMPTTAKPTRSVYKPMSKAAFEKLPKWKQRVRIAKDVIAALRAERITARNMVYLSVSGDGTLERMAADRRLGTSFDLKSTFRHIPSCHVCALGACFVVAVETADRFKVNRDQLVYPSLGLDRCAMRLHLSSIFDEAQLDMIEAAFEGSPLGKDADGDDFSFYVRGGEGVVTWDGKDKLPWEQQRLQSTRRLEAIMRNIIKNRGTFLPSIKRKDTLDHPSSATFLAHLGYPKAHHEPLSRARPL